MDADDDEPNDYPRACCAACRHLHVPDRGAPWYRWLCLTAPAEPGYNPVTGRIQADPPWRRCAAVNHDGSCAMFEAGVNVLNSPHRQRDAEAPWPPSSAPH